MKKYLEKAQKAYKNMDFINSNDARVIRILAELLEPNQRFRNENIKDTIVFFGSARTKSPEEAKIYLEKVKEQIATEDKNQKNSELKEELQFAEKQVFLSRYYNDAVELAKRL